jgi:hypothetical protein
MRYKMKWYTQRNGLICLGDRTAKTPKFQVVTQVKVKSPIETELTESHIALIGSFPEDWRNDQKIAHKINRVARHYFGLTNNLPFEALA